ncbi:hypothetical protein [Myxococcus xanthus]|uniref:hypothetical protein n=1 Tax=Myxococcus xanthus TaxID=34 RepID=UPI0002E2D41B|nr:hypothetical protein [Myxococcus xanthus]UYI13164.1 hypothetical protein N3T43_29505 [Myxococcus xanthus]UYI20531.1 hypothetical protein N1129_29955 [Myxococcus xanthus]
MRREDAPPAPGEQAHRVHTTHVVASSPEGDTAGILATMKRPTEPDAPVMPSLLVFAVAVLLFGSPLRRLWLAEGAPGYLPFAVWLGVILLGGWAAHRSRGP